MLLINIYKFEGVKWIILVAKRVSPKNTEMPTLFSSLRTHENEKHHRETNRMVVSSCYVRKKRIRFSNHS